MATNYQINVQTIYLKDIEEYLKFIAEIVLKPSRYLLKKLNSLSFEDVDDFYKSRYQSNQKMLNNKYVELENEFNNNKFNLYQEMDSLSDSLNKNELFYDEYFDFCEIQDIIKHTLDRDFSLIKTADFEFILGLVIDFSKLINFKIDLIENNDFEEKKFKLKYNEYLTGFNKSKKYYFDNICNESLDDDLFKKYSNIILE